MLLGKIVCLLQKRERQGWPGSLEPPIVPESLRQQETAVLHFPSSTQHLCICFSIAAVLVVLILVLVVLVVVLVVVLAVFAVLVVLVVRSISAWLGAHIFSDACKGS